MSNIQPINYKTVKWSFKHLFKHFTSYLSENWSVLILKSKNQIFSRWNYVWLFFYHEIKFKLNIREPANHVRPWLVCWWRADMSHRPHVTTGAELDWLDVWLDLELIAFPLVLGFLNWLLFLVFNKFNLKVECLILKLRPLFEELRRCDGPRTSSRGQHSSVTEGETSSKLISKCSNLIELFELEMWHR